MGFGGFLRLGLGVGFWCFRLFAAARGVARKGTPDRLDPFMAPCGPTRKDSGKDVGRLRRAGLEAALS